MTEISGITAEKDFLWAITDKPKAQFYKLSFEGEVQQEITVRDLDASDVEAITKDENFVYVGDIGDNEGARQERHIIKVAKSGLKKDKKAVVDGELITFKFNNDSTVDKKKMNNYDCEAMLTVGDSIYLFTKRRTDLQTELFAIPKTPGTYTAQSKGTFDCVGLVTDAAINNTNNEVALIGYNKGHKSPFIMFFKHFRENNFLSGRTERIELADKPWDWQVEAISYSHDNRIFFGCEETKEVKATLYSVKRDRIWRLNKKK